MLFWLAAALLTGCTMALVALPLLRGGRVATVGDDGFPHDREVYLARIREIGEECALGRISPAEAEMAKAEEGRKLIALSAQSGRPAALQSPARFLGPAAFSFLPVFAFFIYLYSGAPGMGDMALATRPDRDTSLQTVAQLLERAEARLAANPTDIRGWTVVAPVYMRLGRMDDAVIAWRNAARLAPDDAAIKASLGEALTVAGDGVVSGEAKAWFEAALVLRPGDAKSRFYLALALGQQGRKGEAEAAWNALIADAPQGAPWLESARAELAALRGETRGPSAEQVEAAADLTPDQRLAMIAGMVDTLAARLAADPTDRDGWRRLVRAYAVLKRQADIESAIAAAGRGIPGEPAFLEELRSIATAAGEGK
jgi:cytochrome c-type biogenesis protein CcmH